MNLSPILTAPPLVQIHIATVLIAVGLSILILFLRKGTAAHKRMGRVWVAAMIVTAIASFGIRTSGGLSLIHLFSVLTLISAPLGVWAIRRGRTAAHGQAMLGLTFGGIGIAGAFAMGEGRLLHAVIWGS